MLMRESAASRMLLPLVRGHRVEAGDLVAGLDLLERRHRLRAIPRPRSGNAARTGRPAATRSMSRGLPSIGWSAVLRAASSRGTLCSRPSVYGWRGLANTCSAVPVSMNIPAYMTFTRSHMPATTPRSCVIRISAVSCSATSSRSRSRICAWIVTSSAVVGSSAIRSLGSQASAMAIIARWRMPPENWCG